MRDFRPGSPLRYAFGWAASLTIWAAFVGWDWMQLQDGALTQRRFISQIGSVTFTLVLMIGCHLWQAWKARQPKPPPVYRSTILD